MIIDMSFYSYDAVVLNIQRIITINNFYLILFSVFLATACQSTESEKITEQPPLKMKPHTPKQVQAHSWVKLTPPINSVKEKKLTESFTLPFNRPEDMIPNKQKNDNEKVSPLLNKQACRDNVKVMFSVRDQNAVVRTYPAELQAQGIILALSQDNKHIKLKATGWFSKNEYLQQWQPYLTKPPLSKEVSLKVGSEFWGIKRNWYLCKVK